MGQRKGQTGNPNGRPKGSRNKDTSVLREKITALLDNYSLEAMTEDLMSIKRPEERLKIIAQLLEYSLPRLSRIEMPTDNSPIQIKVVRE